jgi:hypothetical protein
MAVLSDEELLAYERDGFVRLDEAFPRDLARHCCDLLWDQLPEDRDDPTTWTRPVARIFSQTDPAFVDAATSPRWVEAIMQVAGPNADPTPWMGGTFAVRFPVDGDPGDDGWHIEGSYTPEGESGYWRNVHSKDRALLMLVLFSEVDIDDAPTRIRVGSHVDMPAALTPFGDEGVGPDLQLPAQVHDRPLALATGSPGDVYLCHPFIVHAAQRHHGTVPRFIAQPGVPWKVNPC